MFTYANSIYWDKLDPECLFFEWLIQPIIYYLNIYYLL